eukprot:9324032-Alexandrium_andersonii.AAC.1
MQRLQAPARGSRGGRCADVRGGLRRQRPAGAGSPHRGGGCARLHRHRPLQRSPVARLDGTPSAGTEAGRAPAQLAGPPRG